MATDDDLRKNRGLGMLLASIGGNKANDGGGAEGRNSSTVSNRGQASNVADKGDQGFDMESSGFSGWGDISSNAGGGGTENNPQSNNGQGNAGNTSKAGEQWGKSTKEFQDEDVYGPRSMSRWADIKEYDDDHDSEWFEQENERLAKLYGGKFIYVKYLDSQPGRVGYFCQLCSAEMNARKSLELHCSGMKHLKKKDQWQKGDTPLADPSEKDGPPQPNRKPDRGRPRNEPYGGPQHYNDRPPYRAPSPRYRDGGRPDRRDDYDYGRYGDDYGDDYYRRDMYRTPYDRDMYDGRNPPDPRRDFDPYSGPGPARRDYGDRQSRERFTPYGRREPPPPPIISGSARPDFGRVPHPPAINENDLATSLLFEGISDGSCSHLLKKLAVCRVKSPDDAALAANVSSFLITSLRDYYHKNGPPTVLHLLNEIVLKFDIMKDLHK